MPRKTDNVKAEFRRRAIFEYLKSQSESKSISEIYTALNHSKDWNFTYKTYERDLSTMSLDAGFGIISDDEKWPERFSISPDFDEHFEINLTEENLQILALALANFKNLSSRSFNSYIDQLISNIKTRLPRTIKNSFEQSLHFVKPRTPIDGKARAEKCQILEKILFALRKKYSFNCFYSSLTSPEKDNQIRHFGPVTIEASGGKIYFLVVDLNEKKRPVKRIKLSRICEVSIVEKHFPLPKASELTGWDNSYGGFGGESLKSENIIIIGSNIIGKYFEENELHLSQSAEQLADGTFKITLQMPITAPLIRTLGGFGGNIFSIKPHKLKHEVVNLWRQGINKIK